MNVFNKRWPWIALAILALVIGLGFLGYRALDRAEKDLKESKWVRMTAASVIRKSEGRVYYQIENFDQLNEPRRSRAMQTENERMRKYGPRSTYAVDWYNQVDPGAKIYVRYQFVYGPTSKDSVFRCKPKGGWRLAPPTISFSRT